MLTTPDFLTTWPLRQKEAVTDLAIAHPATMNSRSAPFRVFVFALLVPAAFAACSTVRTVSSGPEQTVATTTVPTVAAVSGQTETPPVAAVAATVTPTELVIVLPSPVPTGTPFLAAPHGDKAVAIPILMYHHLQDLGPDASALQRDWTVSPANFRLQLDLIQTRGFHTVTLAQLVSFFDEGKPLPAYPIILTFDDGWRDDYTVAFPALKERGMLGTFFIPTSYVDAGGKSLITWSEALEMQSAEMEFQGHTINHANLKQVGEEEAMRQLLVSKSKLESKLGRPVVALAYPFGAVNAEVMTWVARAGYRAAVGLCCGYNVKAGVMMNLPRIRISYGDSLDAFAAKLPPPVNAATATPVATGSP
ncbi:MAG: polysaccharide deacetylase family protein [Rudaea sp.]